MNLAVLVLHVKAPPRDFVDIGPVYRFFVANHAMKTCLREFPCAVTLMIFQFCQCFKKPDLQFRRKRLLSLVDHSPGIQESAGASHYKDLPFLWIWLRYRPLATDRYARSSSLWWTARKRVTSVWAKTGSSSTATMSRMSRPTRKEYRDEEKPPFS